MIDKLVIIGVGLIGGSLSRALKQAGAVGQVVGCGRNRQNLEKGLSLGILDSYSDDIAEAVVGADIVVAAVPLGAMQSVFEQMLPGLGDNTIVTDVGSAKASVVQAARLALGDRFHQFVPGHPIAGNERSGVEAGFATLFQNRRIILTPIPENIPAQTGRIVSMWETCGATVESMSIEHHDKVLAATSHLPHMLAYALVHHLSHLNEHEEIFRYAAGGFRDFTRIASSDPVMWRDVCLANGPALLELIEQYQQEMSRIASAIEQGDGDQLSKLFSRAKSERDLLIGNC